MLLITAANANSLFSKTSRLLIKKGIRRKTRDLETLETPDEICLTLTNPMCSIVTLPPRHSDDRQYQYLEAELKWFLSGKLDITPIAPYSSFWKTICNRDLTANSNYGYYAFFQLTNGRSQFDWCVEKLTQDLYSRQAVINFNQPIHKYPGNKDFVCTMGQQFLYRNGQLDSIVWMRSNDFIYGLTYNLPWFAYLHQMMAEKLNLPLGKYSHIASTLHVYEKHYGLLNALAAYKITPEDTRRAKQTWKLWQDFIHHRSSAFAAKIPAPAVK
jgi:thymidylate synthase